MLDALSLKDTKLGLETLSLMGVSPDQIRLVLNRADTSVGIKRSEAEAILGRTPDVFVPSDRQIPRATTDGQPIVVANGRAEAARAFHALADLYVHEDSVTEVVANGNGNGNGKTPSRRLRRRMRARS
jgi:pilus assembly protein CpaE